MTVRDVESLAVVTTFLCLEKPDKVEFSPDGLYLSVALLNKGCVQCFSVLDKEWKCRINEGAAGLVHVFWHPDSRSVATLSDFGVQLAVYSLTDGSTSLITHPKPGLVKDVLAFSECARFLAVIHRIELQDYLGVYAVAAGPVTELAKFKCRSNGNDVASVRWTPGGGHVVAVDSALSYKVAVYTAAGEPVASYEAYTGALGVRLVSFGGPLLAVGSYDGKVRLLSTRSWQVAFVLPLVHPRELDVGQDGGVELAVETLDGVSSVEGVAVPDAVVGKSPVTRYVTRRPQAVKALPRVVPDPRGAPVQGCCWVGRSPCGRYLAARDASMARCLWVWNPLNGALVALLVQVECVTSAEWRGGGEGEAVLAFCTGTPRVYFWRGGSGQVEWVDVGGGGGVGESSVLSGVTATVAAGKAMPVTSLQWCGDGRRLLLRGKEGCVVCDVEVGGG